MKAVGKFISFLQTYWIFVLSLLIFALFAFLAYTSVDPIDHNESLAHFLKARYTLRRPWLFFNPWQRPLFALFSFPFAQFGYATFTLFNSLIALGTALLSYHIANKFRIKHAFLVPLLILFSPTYFGGAYSGLTEPLFSFLLILTFYLLSSDQLNSAVTLASFLPYARQEGFVVVFIFGVYLLFKKKFRHLPLLFIGTIIYGSLYGMNGVNMLRLITDYWHQNQKYGTGSLFFFMSTLPQVIGYVSILCLPIAAIRIVISITKDTESHKEQYLLFMLLVFLALLGTYSLLLWKGLFATYPEPRYLNTVVPLAIIVSLYGLEWLIKFLDTIPVLYYVTLLAIVIGTVVSPFVVFRIPTYLSDNERALQKAAHQLKITMQPLSPIYACNLLLAYDLDIDPFDSSKFILIGHTMPRLPRGSVFVWDNYCENAENRISKHAVLNNVDYRLGDVFTADKKSKIDILNDDDVLVFRGVDKLEPNLQTP